MFDIANLFLTLEDLPLADQVNDLVMAGLNKFLKQHLTGVQVPELTVREIVMRLCGMSGALSWELVRSPKATKESPIEAMAMKQIRYEALPAKCAEFITQALVKKPVTSAFQAHGVASRSIAEAEAPSSYQQTALVAPTRAMARTLHSLPSADGALSPNSTLLLPYWVWSRAFEAEQELVHCRPKTFALARVDGRDATAICVLVQTLKKGVLMQPVKVQPSNGVRKQS